MVPVSMSCCVTAYVAVHTVDAPGASTPEKPGHDVELRPGIGSTTTTWVRGTLPVLVPTNLNVSIAPTAPIESGDAVLTREMEGVLVILTIAVSAAVIWVPSAGVPD